VLVLDPGNPNMLYAGGTAGLFSALVAPGGCGQP
jgi:hypothetical protein